MRVLLSMAVALSLVFSSPMAFSAQKKKAAPKAAPKKAAPKEAPVEQPKEPEVAPAPEPAPEPAASQPAQSAEEPKKDDPFNVPEKPKEEAPAAQVVAPQGYPIAEINRPLALPKMMMEPVGDFRLDFVSLGGQSSNGFSLDLGVAMGIVDNVEAGIKILPLTLSPDAKMGDIPLYGLYELNPMVDGKLRLAGRLTMVLPADTVFQMVADLPVKFKFADMFAGLAGIGMGFSENAFLFNLDFGALVQPIEPLAIMMKMGLHVMSASGGSATAVPLSFIGQYTLMGDLDAFVNFGFPDLNGWKADVIQLIFGAAYRFQL
jgi:hypothetical protein